MLGGASEEALPHSNRKPDVLLDNARIELYNDLVPQVGQDLAEKVIKSLQWTHVIEYFKNTTTPKSAEDATRRQAAIESAFHEEKGSLAATLKRARASGTGASPWRTSRPGGGRT